MHYVSIHIPVWQRLLAGLPLSPIVFPAFCRICLEPSEVRGRALVGVSVDDYLKE